MNQVACAASIKNLLLANIPDATPAQIAAITTLSEGMVGAIATMVQSATITYTTGLGNSGGPVTGVFGHTIT